MNSNSLAAHGHRAYSAVVATTTACAAALAIISASVSVASAHRTDSVAGSVTRCVGGAGGGCAVDIALEVAHRKSLMAQYLVDHARQLHPWTIR
jgi:hypothetical protein